MKKRILWALAACLLLVLAAGGAQAEGEKVYTFGDYSYTVNSYGEATLLSMPAPEDAAEPLLAFLWMWTRCCCPRAVSCAITRCRRISFAHTGISITKESGSRAR